MPPGINLAAVSDALKALSSIGQLVPLAGETIAGALDLASQICEIAQDVKDNKKALQQLAISAGISFVEIARIIQTAEEAKRPEYEAHVVELYKVLGNIKETAAKIDKRGIWGRVWSRGKVKQTIAALEDQLAKACTRFGIYEALRNKVTNDDLIHLTGSILNYQRDTLVVVQHTQITAEMAVERALLEKLNPVAAGYKSDVVSTSTSSCLADTRVRLLEDIKNWARASSSDSPSIFWLSGLAGTGKSTIARTVCETCTTDSGTLCASFFFSRQSAERRDPSRVASSLAFQIALCDRSLRETICKVIQENLDVATYSIAEQIRLLLAEPLQTCTPLARPLIIVLDALDESDARDGKEGGVLLPALAAIIRRTGIFPSVRLFVTSRSETSIHSMFHELTRHSPHHIVQLHEIEGSIVQGDIKHYLEERLRAIRQRIPDMLPDGWPEQADLTALAVRAGVLFVYAAILVRFIGSELDDPKRQLRSILDNTVNDSDKVYNAVDNLYLQILDRAVRSQEDASHRHCERLRDVVGSVIIVREPMSMECLARVTGIEVTDVMLVLRQLTAVLIVPESGPVTIFHPSFPDFILDARRCADARFRVNPSRTHTLLAQKCLQLMNQYLRRDICNIQNPTLLNREVIDLPERLCNTVPQELAYACRHWAAHLSFASRDDPVICADLLKFSREKLLYWIELLSLMGLLHSSYAILHSAQSYTTQMAEAATLMKDADHMIREFYPAIQESALHIYYSAVPFMPRCSILSLVEHESATAVSLLSERREGWREELLHTIQCSAGSAEFMAFIGDDLRVLCTATDQRKKIWVMEVWDTATGERVTFASQSLRPEANGRVGVALSPDGTRLAYIFEEHARIWSTETGECVLELQYPHTLSKTKDYFLSCMTFSSYGPSVAGSTWDCMIYVWNGDTGHLQATLGTGTNRIVAQLCFTNAGDHLICLHRDLTALIWDIQTGELVSEIVDLYPRDRFILSPIMDTIGAVVRGGLTSFPNLQYKVWSSHLVLLQEITLERPHDMEITAFPCPAAFSLNREMVCLNNCGILCVWNLKTGRFLGQLEKTGLRNANHLYISDDARIVALAGDQGKVHVWDTQTLRLTAELIGSSTDVCRICISKDCTRLVSASWSGSVRLWSLSTSQEYKPASIANIDVSASWGGSVRPGRLFTNGEYNPISTVETAIVCLAVSDDGSHVVSATDTLLSIWKQGSRAEVIPYRVFTIHEIKTVAICADGSRIISGHELWAGRQAMVWEYATKMCIATLNIGTSKFIAHLYPPLVTLSADGKRAALVCEDTFGVWNVHDQTILSTIQRPLEQGISPICQALLDVQLSPDGLHVVAHFKSRLRDVHVYEILSGQIIASFQFSIPGCISEIKNMRVKYFGDMLYAAVYGESACALNVWSREANYHPTLAVLPMMFTSDPDISSHWIWSLPQGTGSEPHRICWVPPELHINDYSRRWDSSMQGNIIAVPSARGNVTIMDFTAVQHWVIHPRSSLE